MSLTPPAPISPNYTANVEALIQVLLQNMKGVGNSIQAQKNKQKIFEPTLFEILEKVKNIGTGNIQSDWLETNPLDDSFILNKPTLSNVATSGDYNDLLNLPVLFDGTWASLLGKPTFATVATSGSYNDLINLPTLFTTSDARTSISLTTTGTSGAATYNSGTGVLNIPNYAVINDGDKGDITISNTNSIFTINNNVVTDFKIRQSTGLSVIGRSFNTVGNVADITAGADHHVLRRSGSTLDFGTLNIAGISATGTPSASTFLRGDGTWSAVTGSGVTTMTAIGSSPNANGATISGNNLTLQPASASFGGVVTTGAQTFAGDKTFNNNVNVASTGLLSLGNQINSTRILWRSLTGGNAGISLGPNGNVINFINQNESFINFQWAVNTPDGSGGTTLATLSNATFTTTVPIRVNNASASVVPFSCGNTLASERFYLRETPNANVGMGLNGGLGNADFVFFINPINSYRWKSSASILGNDIMMLGTDGSLSLNKNNSLAVPSAQLEIESTTRGILIPRLTTVQRNAIVSPATGLQVYNTSTNSFDYYNGTTWGNIGVGLALNNIGTTSNAQGATISGNNLTLQPASASFGGVVTTGAQTFAGTKVFEGTITTKLASFANSNAATESIYFRDNGVGERIGIGKNLHTMHFFVPTLYNGFRWYTGGDFNTSATNLMALTSSAFVLGDGVDFISNAILKTRFSAGATNNSPTPSIYIRDAGAGNRMGIGKGSNGQFHFFTSDPFGESFIFYGGGDHTITPDLVFLEVNRNGIGISGARNNSAQLTINSTTRGILIPRLTTAQRNAIATPANGLQVYNTDSLTVDVYASTAWRNVPNGLFIQATIDFDNILPGQTNIKTVTAIGASIGDIIMIGIPNSSMTTGLVFTQWVSATDTLSIQAYNSTTSDINPTSGTFKFYIIKN